MTTCPTPYQIYRLLSLMTVRLDNNNFITWSYQFQTLLEGLDLFSYIDGNTVCPTKYVITNDEGVTNENTATYREWKKTDKAILSLLIATLSFDVLDVVVGSETSKEAWMRLSDRYATNSRSHVMQLKTDLYTITKGMDSVEKYLMKVIRARNHLAALGVTMEDEDIVVVILNGLPADFTLIKTIIRARETPIAMSELRILLLAAERDIGRRVVHNTLHAFSAMRTQKGVSQGYVADNESNIDNKALNGGCHLGYFGSPCTLTTMLAHNTDETQSSGISICAQGFSYAGVHNSDVHSGISNSANGGSVNTDNNCVDNPDGDNEGGVDSGTENVVVDAGTYVNAVENDVLESESQNYSFADSVETEGDFYDVKVHVEAESDNRAVFYAVGNEKCSNTKFDEHLYEESQNESEKAMDDAKRFESEDDQFYDSQQQLEKSEDYNNSVSTDSDEVMSGKGRDQLKKLVESNSKSDEDILDCSGSLERGRYTATNEFHWFPCKRIAHVCGDDYYELSGKKNDSEVTVINYVTMECVLLFFHANTLCRFKCVGKQWNKWISVQKIYHKPDSVLTVAFEPFVLGFEENFQLMCAYSLPDQPTIYFDINSSRLRSGNHSKAKCYETDTLRLIGHGILLKAMVCWKSLVGTMNKNSQVLETLGNNDIGDYSHGRAGLDTRVCSSFCMSRVQILMIEGTILCNQIFYRFITALVMLSNTWLIFLERGISVCKETGFRIRTCCLNMFQLISRLQTSLLKVYIVPASRSTAPILSVLSPTELDGVC